ncbi:MAG: Spy/CpxP family protein refolding chaperone [Paracoccaceae bacterium]
MRTLTKGRRDARLSAGGRLGRAARVAAAALLLSAGAAAAASPYSGEEGRTIASLSEADVAALLAGEGHGFALPAELNGWPGPAHLLDLAEPLALTAEQVAAVETIFGAMRAEAKRLGADYVAAERALDAAFAEREIDSARLAALTAEAGRLRAELRRVHLEAHLAARPLLTRHQIHEYDRLRGYGEGGGAHGHGAHGGHGAHRAQE